MQDPVASFVHLLQSGYTAADLHALVDQAAKIANPPPPVLPPANLQSFSALLSSIVGPPSLPVAAAPPPAPPRSGLLELLQKVEPTPPADVSYAPMWAASQPAPGSLPEQPQSWRDDLGGEMESDPVPDSSRLEDSEASPPPLSEPLLGDVEEESDGAGSEDDGQELSLGIPEMSETLGVSDGDDAMKAVESPEPDPEEVLEDGSREAAESPSTSTEADGDDDDLDSTPEADGEAAYAMSTPEEEGFDTQFQESVDHSTDGDQTNASRSELQEHNQADVDA